MSLHTLQRQEHCSDICDRSRKRQVSFLKSTPGSQANSRRVGIFVFGLDLDSDNISEESEDE